MNAPTQLAKSGGIAPSYRVNSPNPADDRICQICDGGPGNECACLCGFEKWKSDTARQVARNEAASAAIAETTARMPFHTRPAPKVTIAGCRAFAMQMRATTVGGLLDEAADQIEAALGAGWAT